MKNLIVGLSCFLILFSIEAEENSDSFVKEHNKYRTELNIPDVEWSSEIAAYAQEWANYLKSQKCKMQHRSKAGKKIKSYGENLAWASGKKMSPADVVKMWHSEVSDYNYETNKCKSGEVCGHYTQVIWANTKKIGCGVASCGNSEIWVCNYDPPGNYYGEKPY